MAWLQTLDVSLFRLVNQTWSNPVLDVVMPFLSGNRLFYPSLAVLGVWLIWKGGARGRLMAALLFIILSLGDVLVISMLKQAVARPRPFEVIADVQVLVGKPRSGSMPSSHASSWFAATLIAFVHYRWSWRFLLPLAALVGLSRIYVGVHYPSDVLAGAVLGAGYAAAGLWTLSLLWQSFGRNWFPGGWQRMPSLWNPVVQPPAAQDPAQAQAEKNRQIS